MGVQTLVTGKVILKKKKEVSLSPQRKSWQIVANDKNWTFK